MTSVAIKAPQPLAPPGPLRLLLKWYKFMGFVSGFSLRPLDPEGFQWRESKALLAWMWFSYLVTGIGGP